MSHISKKRGNDSEDCADGSQADLANSRKNGCGTVARKVPEMPEELVERIIARMPFPTLFKAASLSKLWRSQFADPSSREGPSSLFFQDQVASVSPRWPVYCPIYVGVREIAGFDKGSGKWRSVLTLSIRPLGSRFMAIAGPLLFLITRARTRVDDCMSFGSDIFVTNVITKTWRKLPKPAHLSHGDALLTLDDHVTVLPLEADGYSVLLVHKPENDFDEPDEVRTHIYDSRLNAWTVKEPRMVDCGRPSNQSGNQSAYMDEKLYTLCESSDLNFLQVWAYDARENLWTTVPHSISTVYHQYGAVLRCGKKIMVACATSGVDNVVIYELLHRPLRLQYVDTSPQNADIWNSDRDYYAVFFSSDADSLYFSKSSCSSHVLTFDVHTEEWGSLPPPPFASEYQLEHHDWNHGGFEPGLNPFMAV